MKSFFDQTSVNMDNQNRIVFMGTPEFAVEPLKKLLEKQYDVAAVVTVADKQSGRGLKLRPSPVKSFALEHNIPVLQPLNLNNPSFIDELTRFKADLFIVVAFRKLPDIVWKLPKLGCFNLHASLLPQYRGAAPINHAIINGEKITGVTTFFLNEGIDTGKMIMQRELCINPDETAGELHDRMMVLGAELVIDTAEAIFSNSYKTTNQPEISSELKKAPKIFREDCQIRWQYSAHNVHNLIRGLSPYPGAYGILDTSDGLKELKVFKSKITGIKSEGAPGSIILYQNRVLISCSDEYLEIIIVQASGKKVMPMTDFIRGNRSKIFFFATP